MKTPIAIASMVLALASPAAGAIEFDLVTICWSLGCAEVNFYLDPDNGLTFSPAPDREPVSLGSPAAPWSHVNARGFSVDSSPGISTAVPLGNGCILQIKGGLVVGVTGGSWFQPCTQP